MNKPSLIASLVAGLALAGLSGAALANNATAAEATAMVKKGVAFIKANGKEKAYAEMSNKSGQNDRIGLHDPSARKGQRDRSVRSDLRAETNVRSVPQDSDRKSLIERTNARRHQNLCEKSRRSRPQ